MKIKTVRADLFEEYAEHQSWRCRYRERYETCQCGLDDLCDDLGIDRIPVDDPEAEPAA